MRVSDRKVFKAIHLSGLIISLWQLLLKKSLNEVKERIEDCLLTYVKLGTEIQLISSNVGISKKWASIYNKYVRKLINLVVIYIITKIKTHDV